MNAFILTVGNAMMGDDGAGALLAKRIQEYPLDNWRVICGGSAPENCLHILREFSPSRVLIIDAADMDLPPGSIQRIADQQLEDPFLLTTHTLPLNYLIEALREFVPRVELLGIQPEIVAFGYPISEAVQQAVERVYERLHSGRDPWDR